MRGLQAEGGELSWQVQPAAELKPGEVRVRVMAAGLNRADLLHRGTLVAGHRLDRAEGFCHLRDALCEGLQRVRKTLGLEGNAVHLVDDVADDLGNLGGGFR